MKMFFAPFRSRSVTEAKNRLKSVIKNDRISMSQNKTLEKMKKEVSALLLKYTENEEQMPQVSVKCDDGKFCVLSAYIPIKEENYIR